MENLKNKKMCLNIGCGNDYKKGFVNLDFNKAIRADIYADISQKLPFDNDTFDYIYSPTHPNKTKDGYVCEHRLVMEKHMGRILTKKEVVHHINGDITDNRIENLMLYSSTGVHALENHIKRGKDGKFKK